jgi:hypothetical protein
MSVVVSIVYPLAGDPPQAADGAASGRSMPPDLQCQVVVDKFCTAIGGIDLKEMLIRRTKNAFVPKPEFSKLSISPAVSDLGLSGERFIRSDP